MHKEHGKGNKGNIGDEDGEYVRANERTQKKV